MGLRGFAQKPSAIRAAEGKPVNDSEPQFARVIPEAPGHLSERAREAWDDLAPMLFGAKLLTEADELMLANLCQAYATMQDAQEQLNRSALIFKTDSGYIQQNPLFIIIRTQSELVLKLCREFGLSPSSRARLTVPQEKDADNDLLDDAVFSRPTRKLQAVK